MIAGENLLGDDVLWLDGIPIMQMTTYGFPLELFDISKEKGISSWRPVSKEGRGVRVADGRQRTSRGEQTERVVKRQQDGKLLQRVKLIRRPGQKWWDEYDKELEGHKDLHAVTYGDWLWAEFDDAYAQWLTRNKEGNHEETHIFYERMKELGIAAVPCMIAKIDSGDEELIPLVAELTSEVDQDATKGECLQWWDENKNRWLAPFPMPTDVKNVEDDHTTSVDPPSGDFSGEDLKNLEMLKALLRESSESKQAED